VDDITSTGKLLDLITNRQPPPPAASAQSKPKRERKKLNLKLKIPSIISIRKSSNIGIDIGHDSLRLAKASQSQTGHWRIDDIGAWNIPANTPRNSPEFGDFLKKALDDVGWSSKQGDIWTIMSAARVEVHTIRIPKVSPAQIANAVYWTLKKSNPFDEQEMLFDYEVQGEVVEQGIAKLAVLAFVAPRRDIEDIRQLFARIGRPLKGVAIVPFALQNLLRTEWIESGEKIITSLYIGNDFSRIDIYASGNLVMTRGIKAGTNSMIEALVESYNETRPAEEPLNSEQARKLLFSVCHNSSPLEPADAGFGVPEGEIFEMIHPAMERIVRQVDMTFKYFTSEQQKGKITEIFVSGALSVYTSILDYIGSQLDIKCEILDPLNGNDLHSLCDGLDDSRCLTERISFAPALGAALSGGDYTPNLIFTFKDKDREKKVKRINQGVFSVFIALVLVFGAMIFYLNTNISRKQSVVSGMEGKLAGIGPEVDKKELLKMASEINKRRNLSKGYAERYLGMALIGEFAARTPPDIRIVSLKINLEQKSTQAEGEKPTGEKPGRQQGNIVLDGLIFGDSHTFDSSLAGYVMTLEASPLLAGVLVQKSGVEPCGKASVLHFILNLKAEESTNG
jgi:type IV pilus assembly protein PilM